MKHLTGIADPELSQVCRNLPRDHIGGDFLQGDDLRVQVGYDLN